MPGRNNTTPIGDGEVGIDTSISSAAGQKIQQVVSESNLNVALQEGNGEMKSLLEATVKMVARWLPGDKLRILQEYGNPNGLPRNPSESQLNTAVAIALISTLPKGELRKIIGKQATNGIKATKDTNNANARAAAMAKKLTVSTSADYFSNVAENADNAQQLLKGVNGSANGSTGDKKDKDGDFSLDENIADAMPSFRKELEQVLNNFSNAEITKIAGRLDITYRDGASSKDVTKKIVNYVNLYAALVLGKTKGLHASGYSPYQIEEIERLLLLTSFGWLTGKVGTTDMALMDRRKAAAKAKKESEAAAKNVSARRKASGSFKAVKFDKKGNAKADKANATDKAIKKAFGKKNSAKGLNAYTKALSKLYEYAGSGTDAITNGILDHTYNTNNIPDDEWNRDKLNKLAASQGIDEYEKLSASQIVTRLAAMMASEEADISKDFGDALKEKDPKKRAELLEKVKARAGNSMVAGIEKDKNTLEQDYSDKIPVVSFNNDGELTSETIAKAVPVFIVGSAKTTGKQMDKDEAARRRDKDSDNATALANEYLRGENGNDLEAFWNNTTRNSVLKNEIRGSFKRDDYLKTDRNTAINKNDYTTGITTIATQPIGSDMDPAQITALNDQIKQYGAVYDSNISQLLQNTNQNKESQTTNGSFEHIRKIGSQYNEAKKKGDERKVSTYKDDISRLGIVLFGRNTFADKDTTVIPVLDVGKSSDYLLDIFNYQKTIESELDTVVASVTQLPTLMMGLQMGGTAFNLESAAAGVSTALNIASAISSNLNKYATGGSMRASRSNSTIITGDPMRGSNKANPEVVSVDWANHKINVKPIPQLATGGNVNNDRGGVSEISRMTSSERNAPLSVGIANGVVTYSKKLNDVTDDSMHTAVKVYSINSGINEKIKVGETELSLFDAVYGLYGSVATIEQAVVTGTQVLAAIEKNTAGINISASKMSNNSGNGGTEAFKFPSNLDSILAGE